MRRPKLAKIRYTLHDRTRLHKGDRRLPLEERSEFERDRSRIIHSAAFRRLQGKTQIFTVGEGDFYRTRLTHSLEVAQIGKGIALRLGADTDLVEAICLIHDIGHPPFGHAGEDELKKLMKRYGGFEANAQNIRILTLLERKSTNYLGLNLTRAVLDGQMKYKTTYDEKNDIKKFIYAEDAELMEWVSEEAREVAENPDKSWQSFESAIMDWADDIAYAVHDLEDSIREGFINVRTFQDTERINRLIDALTEDFPGHESDVGEVSWALINDHILNKYPDFRPLGPLRAPRERSANRKELTSSLIGKYVKSTNRNERKSATDDIISRRYIYELDTPIESKIEVAFIKKLAWEFVIQSPQVRLLEERGRHIVRCLFLKFIREENTSSLLPEDWQDRLPHGSSRRHKARVVSDYISGMTDNYAQKTYAKLFLPNQGSIYEIL